MTSSFLIFISNHGYGHLSRMRHLLRELSAKSYHQLVIVTLNHSFFLKDLNRLQLITLEHDVGTVQKDSFTVDLDATLQKLEFSKKNEKNLMKIVISQILNFNIQAVITDISPFAFKVANKLGVPAYLVGNFTWSDIYSDYSQLNSKFSEFVEEINEDYLSAKKCFALPMHTSMLPFEKDKILEVPFLAPQPSSMTLKKFEFLCRQKMNKKKTILLSFGGFDFHDLPFDQIKKLTDYYFISTASRKTSVPNIIYIKSPDLDYLGLIKHCDVVMTKPGYGIISDCLVHKKPMIYTERGRFKEYDVLVNWLYQHFPSFFLNHSRFLKGAWMESLEKASKNTFSFPVFPTNGASVIATYILSHM